MFAKQCNNEKIGLFISLLLKNNFQLTDWLWTGKDGEDIWRKSLKQPLEAPRRTKKNFCQDCSLVV